MNQNRYIYTQEPLPEAEARAMRDRQIESYVDSIKEMQEDIRRAEQELAELRNSPLQTHITVQRTLRPGDEGYENAPVPGFRMVTDEGARKFIRCPLP